MVVLNGVGDERGAATQEIGQFPGVHPRYEGAGLPGAQAQVVDLKEVIGDLHPVHHDMQLRRSKVPVADGVVQIVPGDQSGKPIIAAPKDQRLGLAVLLAEEFRDV